MRAIILSLVAACFAMVSIAGRASVAAAGTGDKKRIRFNDATRAAITTTFRVENFLEADWKGAVEWWVDWHVNTIGFERVYFFADSRYTVNFLRKVFGITRSHPHHDHVTVVGAWKWRTKATEEDLYDFIGRQVRNCEEAYRRAAKEGLGWLVHMDVDELFYPKEQDLQGHLARLEERQIGSFTYRNLEAVQTPSTSLTANYFQDVTLFKRHPSEFGMSPEDLWQSEDSPMVKLGFAAPTHGSTKGENRGKREYFFSYSNGKSIVRVVYLPKKLRPDPRNHYWVWDPKKVPKIWQLWRKQQGKTLPANGRLTNAKGFSYRQISHAKFLPELADDVLLLHFVNCGKEFWKDKYRLLGRFHDNYSKQWPIPFDSTLDSRDAVASIDEVGEEGSTEANARADAYFRSTFVCEERTCIEQLEKFGVLAKGINVASRGRELAQSREL